MNAPDSKSLQSIIKIIGVGGGGGNAINYMYNMGVNGVDFIICNTDSQALAESPIPNKIQLGPHLTQGLGAGANPEIGMQASEESVEDIAKMLKTGAKMAFVTAGMGGGTGTGGAPVVARLCRELGILTVGIVTTPFTHEGPRRMKQAKDGIDRLREHVDTILIISNDKLRQQFGSFKFTEAFSKADDVLATATKCITEVITTTGRANVDFADVSTVMRNGGVAILGHASAAGENRALHAVEAALSSPLLNDSDIRGAKWILLNVTSAEGEHEHTLDELDAINAYVQQQAGENCDVILGMGHDEALEDKVAVTIIATGFQHKEVKYEAKAPGKVAGDNSDKRVVGSLNDINNPFRTQTAPAPEKAETPVAPQPQPTTASTSPFQTSWATTTPAPTPAPVPPVADTVIMPEEPAAAPGFRLITKEAEPEKATATVGSQPSKEDLEEERRFEEQKKALEERAERLRRLSFNVKSGETSEDIENVPAYMRRNNPKADPTEEGDDDKTMSGYSVGYNNGEQGGTASVQSINTFLDGKKPD